MTDFPKPSEMHAEAEKDLIDFLQTGLALCATFADLGLTELSLEDWPAVQSALAKSEEEYATIAHTKVKDGRHRLSVEQQLDDLRNEIR